MSGTRQKAIRNAVAQLVEGGLPAGLVDGGVMRGKRRIALAEQYSRGVWVWIDTSLAQRAQYRDQADDWTTRVRIECCARSLADGTLAEDVADDLAAQIYALLLGEPFTTWANAFDVSDFKPLGVQWDTDEADTQLAVTQVAIDVQHRLPAASINA